MSIAILDAALYLIVILIIIEIFIKDDTETCFWLIVVYSFFHAITFIFLEVDVYDIIIWCVNNINFTL